MEKVCKRLLVIAVLLPVFFLHGCIGAGQAPEASPSPAAQATASPEVFVDEEGLAQEFDEIFGELEELEELGDVNGISVTEDEWEILES